MLCNKLTVSREAFERNNEYFTSVKFTSERQIRGSIAFLGALFTRLKDES